MGKHHIVNIDGSRKRSGVHDRCGRPHTFRGFGKVACRLTGGHKSKHAFWSKSCPRVEWK